MAIPWRNSAAEFARILRAHGTDLDAVTDVDAAWAAFEEFLQVEIAGIDSDENDGDGFNVEWGRWTWTDRRPALAFRRLLGVLDTEDRQDPQDQPEYWTVELELSFAEDPAWADLNLPEYVGAGLKHYRLGAERRAAMVEEREYLGTFPQLAALWRAEPIHSRVVLEQV